MELNHTNNKQTLLAAMKNENHHCLSDSDSTDSETEKAIKYSSPARFHSNSDYDSDDSTKSDTDKARNIDTNTTSTAAATHTSVNRDSTKVSSPPVESPARSSISSDQISLPHESFHPEDNKPYAAPTRSPPEKPPSPEAVVKRSIKEEPLAIVKADLVFSDGTTIGEGGDGGGGNRRRKVRPPFSIIRKGKRDEMVKKAALGFRIFGFLFCLVSFSVLAADRNQGWALDSFERYKEFRYSMSVNVIGFVYSGAQAFNLAYQSATGKNVVQHHLRYFFDFALDQIVTYLLISASSSAATRIDDWQSNWGKDKFPDMASASVAMSFLAFAALAFSSLISGYVLCNSRST
ncbi:CASP-like protein 4A3 isoform X1 [Nicotiana sylvestris]|uniref:CASP-like protein n=1 Tax=Nicotiana sylvestris TaxID=4096 RepID=A0A1U7V782_NICSY|nr:PREDICTED: CASP-like protein 4A3 isoform X1 [Nicotiana sylvestris]